MEWSTPEPPFTHEERDTCPYCGKRVPNIKDAEYESWWEGDNQVTQYFHWNCLTQAAAETEDGESPTYPFGHPAHGGLY